MIYFFLFFLAFPPRPLALRAGAFLAAAFLLADFFGAFRCALALGDLFRSALRRVLGRVLLPLFAAGFLAAFFAGGLCVTAFAGALDVAGLEGGATGSGAAAGAGEAAEPVDAATFSAGVLRGRPGRPGRGKTSASSSSSSSPPTAASVSSSSSSLIALVGVVPEAFVALVQDPAAVLVVVVIERASAARSPGRLIRHPDRKTCTHDPFLHRAA